MPLFISLYTAPDPSVSEPLHGKPWLSLSEQPPHARSIPILEINVYERVPDKTLFIQPDHWYHSKTQPPNDFAIFFREGSTREKSYVPKRLPYLTREIQHVLANQQYLPSGNLTIKTSPSKQLLARGLNNFSIGFFNPPS